MCTIKNPFINFPFTCWKSCCWCLCFLYSSLQCDIHFSSQRRVSTVVKEATGSKHSLYYIITEAGTLARIVNASDTHNIVQQSEKTSSHQAMILAAFAIFFLFRSCTFIQPSWYRLRHENSENHQEFYDFRCEANFSIDYFFTSIALKFWKSGGGGVRVRLRLGIM